MNDNSSTATGPDTRSSRRAKRFDIALGVFVLLSGLGVVSGPFFERAQRELLADRCLYPMSTTDGMSAERISEEVSECADFLGWGGGETFFKVMERMPFAGWVVMVVTIFLALRHKRLLHRWSGTTFGQWLDKKIDARRRTTFPPPNPTTRIEPHDSGASES